MKYCTRNSTLIISGEFEGLSTGINGGRGYVESIFNHEVNKGFDFKNPVKYLDNVAEYNEVYKPYFGLLTAVEMENLCIKTDDYLTTFVTAGITHPSVYRLDGYYPGTINIILVVDVELSEGAMAGAIITATEAKGLALMKMGYDFLGTTTDAVVVAYQKQKKNSSPYIEYAGSYTDFGKKITDTVVEGVKEGIKKTHPESVSY
ncbi:adenosylcobinamide amidohydrolase [Methanohalobium sp.]|uniref:adenosylcobinamide amidohydrolase n=1 Tax=Methanohalobium sp. TaxID=2837493 RepID=UPI0025D18388|nr:adenosylcobinamide amidohydrolase [Methanohalobium sp.]